MHDVKTLFKTDMNTIFTYQAAFLLLGISYSNGADAQIFKCQNAMGKIEFSDAPCNSAHTTSKIRAQPNSLDSSGSRELSLRLENEKLREQLSQQPNKLANGVAPQRTQPDLQSERIDTIACERAKRDYEITASASSYSDKPAIVEAKRSMMYGACGMREPNKDTTNINVDVDICILIR